MGNRPRRIALALRTVEVLLLTVGLVSVAWYATAYTSSLREQAALSQELDRIVSLRTTTTTTTTVTKSASSTACTAMAILVSPRPQSLRSHCFRTPRALDQAALIHRSSRGRWTSSCLGWRSATSRS